MGDMDRYRCDHCRKDGRTIGLVGSRTTCYSCLEIPTHMRIIQEYTAGWVQNGSVDVYCRSCGRVNCVRNSMDAQGRDYICMSCIYKRDRLFKWTVKWRR